MASTTITIPDFNFTGFYYPQILEALIQYKRQNVPELTDESEFEPFIQLLRAFACVGHLNSVDTDLVALESTLPTAKLVETVRNMLRLIGYEMSPATPAQVELLYKLARTFSTSIQVVNAGARAATERSGDSSVIPFEANEALTISRTDQVGAARSLEGTTYTDRTAALVSTLPINDFDPWTTPDVGDMMLFGHPEVMWDRLDLDLTSFASGINGVWEFYDGDWLKSAPDSVTPAGASLTVVLNGWLGLSPVPGTVVRVTLNETGAYEEAVSQWNGSQNFVTVGLLGQSSPETDPTKYSVGSDWSILDDVVDGSNHFQQAGNVTYEVPQTVDKRWEKTTVDGTEAYWLRYRITVVVSPVSPTIHNAVIDGAGLYVLRLATQGISAEDDPLGSSTGLPDQRFETSRDNFISGSSVVTVDGTAWTEVDDFVNSQPADRHYAVELGENDRATIVFGSGDAGKIPPLGVNNISVEYRYGAQDDGNVGPDTVTVDKQGLTYVNSITNPRQASGWREAEGASEASLERAKQDGPASLRAKEVALGPDDVVTLTKAYTDEFGSRLFSRALAIEEGLGPKTIELVVVPQGGGTASSEQLSALDTYFNGDKTVTPNLPSRIVANQQVTSFNYTPKYIDITATVTTRVTAQEIANRLNQVFTPEALKDDGVTYEWEFGGEVPISRISHEIFETDESTTKVELTTPAVDVPLGARELPMPGTIVINVLEP